MNLFSALPLIALSFFAAILIFLEFGRRIGNRRLRIDPEGARTGIGAIEGAVFGLLGLLIAFTFSGAAERMNMRRSLIVQETNAIGTAWLRFDLLPADSQPVLRQQFRDYTDLRIAYYHDLHDTASAQQENARATELQLQIWQNSVAAVAKMSAPALGVSLLQALNEVIDITTTRHVAMKTHPPLVIYLMLGLLTLISALFIGFGMAGNGKRNWLHSIGYALVMVSALYVILDFEFPRAGIIRIEQFDQIMLEQRKSMD
jgi:hypothetical protein